MNRVQLLGIALIVAGVLGLAYRGFTYTTETHDVKVGPIEMVIKDEKTVNIPVWAGAGAILAGGLLVVFGGRKR